MRSPRPACRGSTCHSTAVDPQRFAELTRRDLLPKVLEGIAAIQAHPGIHQVKLNAVAMRGIIEHEALDLIAFARAHDLQVRFIEAMPLDAGLWLWTVGTTVVLAIALMLLMLLAWSLHRLGRAGAAQGKVAPRTRAHGRPRLVPGWSA